MKAPFPILRMAVGGAIGVASLSPVPQPAQAQSQPAPGDFVVNSSRGPAQGYVDVAMDHNGRALVVWTQGTFPQREIRLQRYDLEGTPLGSETVVSTSATIDHSDPAIHANRDGTFTVVWTTQANAGGSTQDVFSRRFTSAGTAVGGAIRVNSTTTSNQNNPDIASDDQGNTVIVWTSSAAPDGTGVFAQRLDQAGTPLSGEFRANSWTTGNQNEPAVAVDPVSGDFLIAWTSDQEADAQGIYAQRYSWAGATLGGEFQVNSWTTNAQTLPDVMYPPEGLPTIVWRSRNQDGSGSGIYGQRYNRSGAPRGEEFQVHNTTFSTQFDPAIASDAIGNAIVTWESFSNDGDDYGVFAQQYTFFRSLAGGETQVNTFTGGAQQASAVAFDAIGNGIVAWTSRPAGRGDVEEIRARLLRAPQPSGALSSEFQVDTHTTFDQNDSAVAMQPDGSFLVVWARETSSASNPSDLFARGFDKDGVALDTPNFIVVRATLAENSPSLATVPDGSFVAVWHDELSTQISGRQLAADGSPIGGEFTVNQDNGGEQELPDIARLSSGEYIVVWQSDGSVDEDLGIRGQRIDASGSPISDEFAINTNTVANQTDAAVAASPEEGFVVAWRTDVAGSSYSDIHAQRFDDSGSSLAGEFLVNVTTSGFQGEPDVTFLEDGSEFVVVWEGFSSARGGYTGAARRFAASGQPIAGEFAFADNDIGVFDPSVRPAGAGFVVAWSEYYDGDGDGVLGRHFSAAGSPLGRSFLLNSYRFDSQSEPALAALPNGNFVVSWTSRTQDGDSDGVFARRLTKPLFVDGFESGDTVAWSQAIP